MQTLWTESTCNAEGAGEVTEHMHTRALLTGFQDKCNHHLVGGDDGTKRPGLETKRY